MTAALQPRRVRTLGLAVVLASLASPGRDAGAAEPDCWGSWRFEVSPPSPDKEMWLSAGSWCRGAKLPRTFSVEVRPGPDGRAIWTGAPLRPVDVLVGAGKCDFRFAEGPGGPPKNHELAIEVNRSGAIRGTARCSERTPGSEGNSTGITVGLDVTGSRSSKLDASKVEAPVPAPDSVEPRAAAVVAACRQRDGAALWKLMTPRFCSEVDAEAARVRRAVPAADLPKLYGHSGRPSAFNGLAFLRHAVRTNDRPNNPCFGVDQWQVGSSVPSEGGLQVIIERPEGYAFALKFTRSDRGWQLDQITKSVRVPKR